MGKEALLIFVEIHELVRDQECMLYSVCRFATADTDIRHFLLLFILRATDRKLYFDICEQKVLRPMRIELTLMRNEGNKKALEQQK